MTFSPLLRTYRLILQDQSEYLLALFNVLQKQTHCQTSFILTHPCLTVVCTIDYVSYAGACRLYGVTLAGHAPLCFCNLAHHCR